MNSEIVKNFDDDKDDSIKLTLQRCPDIEKGLLIYASGYIDTYNSNTFRKRIDRAIQAGFAKIIFVMAGVNYASSTAIGSFTYFLKTVKPLNGDIVLDQVQPKVFEVFDLLGFSQFFAFTHGLSESLAHFSIERHPAFPKIFKCPVCYRRLKASKAGRFRCSECRTILVVDSATSVMLG